MKQIQLFKPVYDIPECLRQINECLTQGWTGQGFKTVEFEEKFKEYCGFPNAHFLNSATSGLHLALEILKIKYKNPKLTKVITTPLTFISDSHVIRHAGLEPIFVDIDETLCMNPLELRKTLSEENNAIAVIYVGIGGNTGKLHLIKGICDEMCISLILDASHMMGTLYDGRQVGNEADYSVFSFQSVKNLSTADSGMIVCQDQVDDRLARSLSWLGINKNTWVRQTRGGNWDYQVDFVGWKYHGNSIMAAIALAQLRTLRAANAIRVEQAGRYTALNENIYKYVPLAVGCRSSRHLYQVRVDARRRERIIREAGEKGVQLGVHYKSHQDYPMYADVKNYCPKAMLASRELISLPIGPHLTEDDTKYIVEVLNGIKV